MASFANASTQICRSLQVMKRKKPVNIIVFGGSVTNGGYASGCYEGDCRELEGPHLFCKHKTVWSCGWQYTLLQYLQQVKGYDVHHFAASKGASSSCTAPQLLMEQVEKHNLTVSADDIVLFDYSVNDGVIYANDAVMYKRLYSCLLSFLGRLFELTGTDQLPTVILLEYFPYTGGKKTTERSVDSGYATIYRKVAQLFHLPILSYRELYWSPVFRHEVAKYPKFQRYVRNEWTSGGVDGDVHPPWIIHDLQTDLMVASLRRIEHICEKREGAMVEIGFNITATLQEVEGSGGHSLACRNCQTILHEIAEVSKAPLLSLEEAAKLPYGWKLYQDRVKKPGWIIEDRSNTSSPSSDALLKFSVPYPAVKDGNSRLKAVLEVVFMKTYRNAGGFSVSVCGKQLVVNWPAPLRIIDTLIVDVRYTTADVMGWEFSLEEQCPNSVGGQMEVAISHVKLDDHLEERVFQKVKIQAVRLEIQNLRSEIPQTTTIAPVSDPPLKEVPPPSTLRNSKKKKNCEWTIWNLFFQSSCE